MRRPPRRHWRRPDRPRKRRFRHACRLAYPLRGADVEGTTVSHKHENLLRAIFHDPISANIHWREVESLIHHLGADVEPLSGARIRVKLNGYEGILHRPHHGNT